MSPHPEVRAATARESVRTLLNCQQFYFVTEVRL